MSSAQKSLTGAYENGNLIKMQKAETIRFSPSAVCGCWLQLYNYARFCRANDYVLITGGNHPFFYLQKFNGGEDYQQGIAH